MADNINIGDLDTLTRVLISEAGGEGPVGLLASAAVIRNRARATGLSMSDITRQRGQFEPMMTTEGRARMRSYRPGTKLWNDAQAAINRAQAGEDPTNGATHFWSPRAQRAAGRPAPSWGRAGGTMIGNHSFHNIGYRTSTMDRAYSLFDGGTPAEAPTASAPTSAPVSLDDRRRQAHAAYRGTLDLARLREQDRDQERGEVSARAARDNLPTDAAFNALLSGNTRDIVNDGVDIGGSEIRAEQAGAAADQDQAADDFYKSFDQQGAWAANELPTTRVFRAIERAFFDDGPRDPNWSYGSVMEASERGKSIREVEDLRRSTSASDLAFRLERQTERQAAARSLDNAGGQTLNFGMQMFDPISWVAAGGVGKGLQVLRMGSSALALGQGAARNAAVVGSLALEGAAGNVAITGILEASGEYKTADDYMMDALVGAGMGAAFTPLVSRAGHRAARQLDAETQGVIDEIVGTAMERRVANTEQAMAELGPDASPAQVNARRVEIDNASAQALQDDFANPFPPQNQVRNPDRVIPDGVRKAYEDELTLYAEGPERAGIVEARYALTQIDSATPTDPRRGVVERTLMKLGLASAGLTMGRSASAALRGAGKLFAEGASGFSGRGYTVAMDTVQNQLSLDAGLVTIDSAFMAWRKETDFSLIQQYTDTEVYGQFMDKVSTELRRRERPDLYPRSTETGVAQAADTFADFYKKAGEMQREWKTVGSGAIDSAASWYFPQEISTVKLLKLSETEGGLARYQGILEEQARTIFGWDPKFAKEFSGRYLRGAMDRANSSYTTPANLSHPHAHDFVREIIDGMKSEVKTGRDLDALNKIEQEFARGGKSHTKARLNFDVNHVYGKGDDTYSLMDIMSTDQLSLARGYSRRVAGDVALTKAGVYGKHGLDEVRAAIMVDKLAGKVTDAEMAAFDQTVAEIMGQPFGGSMRGGAAMDNLRLLSSAINLGGAIFNQVAEATNGFATIGVKNTLASIPEVSRLVEEIGQMKRGELTNNPWVGGHEELLGYGPGSESYIRDRIFDSPQENGSLYGSDNTGDFSRAARGLSHAQFVVSGQRVATAVQTRWMSEQIVQKALRDVRGPMSDLDIRILEDMGFNAHLRDLLKRDDMVRLDDNGNIVGSTLTTADISPRDKHLLVSATNRGANQIIQSTYPGEVGAWAHNDVLKLLLQFRTYPIVAAEKQWMRQVLVQGGSSTAVGVARTIGTMVGALGFIAPLHIARVHMQSVGMSEEKRQEYLERRLSAPAFTQALMNYLSAAHLTGDLVEFGGKSVVGFAGVFGVDVPALEGMANTRGDFVGGSVAPSLGVINDVAKVATGDVSRLPNLMVGRNLPFLAIPRNVAERTFEEDQE